jgi:peptidoglycan biosynthesis protein MviN/MurJ (putative lipid II flippase)
MSTLVHLLVVITTACGVFIAATLLFVSVLERSAGPPGRKWGKLVVSLLSISLGVYTLVAARIQHWYFPELGTSGPAARIIGFLLLVIGVMYFLGWMKERRTTPLA